MLWARFDCQSPSHPKIHRAGAEAAWLWHSSICYSNLHHLNGRLSKDILCLLYAPLAKKTGPLARKLCEVGLWHDRGDHFEIHDYAVFQEQALKEQHEAKLEAKREYERERKRVQRGVPDNVPDNDVDRRKKSSGTESGTCPVLAPAGVPARVPAGAVGSDVSVLPSEAEELSDFALARKLYVAGMEAKRIAFMQWGTTEAIDAFRTIADFAAAQAHIDGLSTGQVIAALLDQYFAEDHARWSWNVVYLKKCHRDVYLRHPGVTQQRAAAVVK